MSEQHDGNAPQSVGAVGAVTERIRDLVGRARACAVCVAIH